jgi:hypothetical protein
MPSLKQSQPLDLINMIAILNLYKSKNDMDWRSNGWDPISCWVLMSMGLRFSTLQKDKSIQALSLNW